MMFRFLSSVATTSLLLLTQSSIVSGQSLAQLVMEEGLTFFQAAATETGQFAALSGTSELTVFAPNDAAFEMLPPGALPWLLQNENIGTLSQILSHHFIGGVLRSVQITDGLVLRDKTFLVDSATNIITVNGAQIVVRDLAAENGILHIIDQVLIPEGITFPTTILGTAENNPMILSTLVAAVKAANAQGVLSQEGPLTVFAPSNQAFSEMPVGSLTFLKRFPTLLGQVLLYHVTSGSFPVSALSNGQSLPTLLENESLSVFIDGSTTTRTVLIGGVAAIEQANIQATNGYVHVIDTVLTPPGMTIAPSIADIGIELGQFNTLFIAVEAAGFVSALNSPGPLTVFAPTDAAFDKLTNLNAILGNRQLLELILSHHVVSGKLLAADLVDGQVLTTLAQQTLVVSKNAATGEVTINGNSLVTLADLEGSNGVIHAVDTVLIPETSQGTQAPATAPTAAPVSTPAPAPGTSGTDPPTGSSAPLSRTTTTTTLAWVGAATVAAISGFV